MAAPKVGEKLTEFYILGFNGKAQDYPIEFNMKNNQVTLVSYGGVHNIASQSGKVTIVIVNHEQQMASYSIVVRIESEQVNITYAGQSVSQIGNIELQHGEKWEQEIGFAPKHIGDNQNVEFLLYKDGNPYPENFLFLWINVTEAK